MSDEPAEVTASEPQAVGSKRDAVVQLPSVEASAATEPKTEE